MKMSHYSCLIFFLVPGFTTTTFISRMTASECIYESLHAASQDGNLEAVKTLIARGGNVNEQDQSGLTPLHHAIKNERVRVIHELISAGANPNIQDKAGKTPYEYAMAKALRYNWNPTWKKITQMLK